MAKKNRYKIEQAIQLMPNGTNKVIGYNVVDTTVMVKNTIGLYAPSAYEMAHGCTEDDALEIAQALNYYNNRDKD